jgi:streptogramin lyase
MDRHVHRLVVVMTAICFLTPLPALAQLTYVRSIDLASGTRPYGIAFTRDGQLLVTSQGRRAVLVLNQDGSQAGAFGSLYPAEVAVDAFGDIYAADHYGGIVFKFSASYQPLAAWPNFATPVGIAIDALGDLWLSEAYTTRIRHLTSDGQELAVVSGAFLQNPYGVAVDANGDVLVANYAIPTIVRLSPSGALLSTISAAGSGGAGLCVRSNGEVLVAKVWTSQVDAFAPDGTLLYSVNGTGDVGGGFGGDSPTDVAEAPDGLVYVVDRARDRICVFHDAATPALHLTWGALKSKFR